VYVWVLCLLVCVLVELMFSSQGIATMAKRVSELRLTLCVCLCVGGRCVCLGGVFVMQRTQDPCASCPLRAEKKSGTSGTRTPPPLFTLLYKTYRFSGRRAPDCHIVRTVPLHVGGMLID